MPESGKLKKNWNKAVYVENEYKQNQNSVHLKGSHKWTVSPFNHLPIAFELYIQYTYAYSKCVHILSPCYLYTFLQVVPNLVSISYIIQVFTNK